MKVVAFVEVILRKRAAKQAIDASASVEGSGMIDVMALDMTGGRMAQVDLQRQSGLTDEDIRREAEFIKKLKIQ